MFVSHENLEGLGLGEKVSLVPTDLLGFGLTLPAMVISSLS